jgi:hypothetical protein
LNRILSGDHGLRVAVLVHGSTWEAVSGQQPERRDYQLRFADGNAGDEGDAGVGDARTGRTALATASVIKPI